MNKDDFISLRKQIIENDFKSLNNRQKEAVFSTEGPLLVLAGAGSGKTTVLVNRVANIIKYGNAYYSNEFNYDPDPYQTAMLMSASQGGELPEDLRYLLQVNPAKPWQILAITFTNKAANELKSRLSNMIGPDAGEIWASTFHAACVRILRRNAGYLNFTQNFTIYDTDDSKRVIKDCLKQLGLSDKIITPKACINEISKAKNMLISPEEYAQNSADSYDYLKSNIGSIYSLYQQKLIQSDAMDFDDIIYYTVKLFHENEDILEYYQNKFKYILVDEYQDTNHMQYELVSLLANKHKNICVVGDDDQSIYRFRGATIENILSFENEYSGAKVIRLEQNYRSTQIILDAANNLIANNENRKGKNLWTDKKDGEKITYHKAEDDRGEGYFVADNVLKGIRNGKNFSDFAVLYRMNSQSNLIEQAFVRNSIPYRMVGGHKFYDRKEIKDAISYLSVVANHNDSVRMSRIINEPKRGIGESTFNKALQISSDLGMPLFDVLKTAEDYPILSRTAKKLAEFADYIDYLTDYYNEHGSSELLKEIISSSGYERTLDEDPVKKEERLENLDQLYNNIVDFERDNEEADLNDFLQEISLMTDIDSYNSDSDSVVMMTVHSAKGLEFNTVFIVGMEENIFPSDLSVQEGEFGIEEERRLAYVAVTRAKEKLYLTCAQTRMLFGMTRYNQPSRFISEIPESLIEPSDENKAAAKRAASGSYRIGSDYGSRQNAAPKKKDYGFSGVSSKPKPSGTVYKTGDTVKHKIFGEGVVLSVTPMSNDQMLEIAFINGNTKKIMANYAKMEKVNN